MGEFRDYRASPQRFALVAHSVIAGRTGAEYEIKRYQRDPETMLAPPELRRVHPLGT
jgi:hypothetical protein